MCEYRKVESSERDKKKLEGIIHEITLDNDSATRSLKAIVKTKEELLITENFVRLDVKRLRDILLFNREDETFEYSKTFCTNERMKFSIWGTGNCSCVWQWRKGSMKSLSTETC